MSKFIWGIKHTILKDPDIQKRLEQLSDIKFKYVSEQPIEGHYSCFKLFIGKKFYIVKTKSLQWTEQNLNKLLKAYNSNGMDGKDLYFPIVKNIHNTGIYELNIEFICQSSNPYDVIKAEFISLQENFGKRSCLNKNKNPYMPKYKPETKMHGWLTVNQYLNYKRLVKKYE